MRCFHVILVHHRIFQCGIYLLMPQQMLYLFYRHSLVYRPCCKSTTELVRMNTMDVQPLSEIMKARFYTADLETVMRIVKSDEKSRIIVGT